jgi:hypothetical protein
MDPIQEAIEGIESREDGASLSYLEVAKKFGLIDHVVAKATRKTAPKCNLPPGLDVTQPTIGA